MRQILIPITLLALLLAGCTAQTAAPAAVDAPAVLTATMAPSLAAAASATPEPTPTVTVTASAEPTPTISIPPTATPDPAAPTAEPRLAPDYWGGWQIVPAVSARARELYIQGVQRGNNPYAFSTIGDCQSEPNVFLGIYETDRYNLGNFQYLQSTIDHFRGSFSRKSAAVKDGMSVASALAPLWADPQQCEANETPVACELRVHKPVIVFINLGTNWNGSASAYEKYLRQVVELVMQAGSVPLLTTKADNIEGDNSLNLATARVAYDYDLPLMNFWLASNDMPNHGLDADRDNVYLTPDGWDRRNFYALVALDALWNDFRQIYDPGAAAAVQ